MRTLPDSASVSSDVSEVGFGATNGGLVTTGDMMVEPLTTLTSDLRSDLSLSPPPPRPEDKHAAEQVRHTYFKDSLFKIN